MDIFWKDTLWRQFGAAIDSIEDSICLYPDKLWQQPDRKPMFWYYAFHTLFYLDFYLSESKEAFAPPEPFGLEELDPAGVMPPRAYTQAELLSYLEYGRQKCRRVINAMTEERAREDSGSLRPGMPRGELLLYNMRHVQHHMAQMNLILRQTIDNAPRWTSRARQPLAG